MLWCFVGTNPGIQYRQQIPRSPDAVSDVSCTGRLQTRPMRQARSDQSAARYRGQGCFCCSQAQAGPRGLNQIQMHRLVLGFDWWSLKYMSLRLRKGKGSQKDMAKLWKKYKDLGWVVARARALALALELARAWAWALVLELAQAR